MAADPCPGRNTSRANPGCRPAASGDEPLDPVRREEARAGRAWQVAAVGSNGWGAADGFAARRWESDGDDRSFSWWEGFLIFPSVRCLTAGPQKSPSGAAPEGRKSSGRSEPSRRACGDDGQHGRRDADERQAVGRVVSGKVHDCCGRKGMPGGLSSTGLRLIRNAPDCTGRSRVRGRLRALSGSTSLTALSRSKGWLNGQARSANSHKPKPAAGDRSRRK